MDYPIEYYNLLSSIQIDVVKHTLVMDEVAMNIDIKDYETPYEYNLLLSSLAYKFSSLIKTFTPKLAMLDSESIYYQVVNTSLPNKHYGIYSLIKGIYLETLAINYANDKDNSLFDSLSIEDIKRVRNNIEYVCDWLGSYREYRKLIEYFRTADLSLGYIQNSLDVLLNGVDKLNGIL